MEKSVFRKKNGIIFRPDFELHINETLTCLPLKTASCNVTPHYYCNTLICHIPFYCDISSANNNIKIMQATVTHSHQQFVALRVRDALRVAENRIKSQSSGSFHACIQFQLG